MAIIIPSARCASSGSSPKTDDQALKEKRQVIKNALQNRDVVTTVGPRENLPADVIPLGDSDIKEKRRRIKEALQNRDVMTSVGPQETLPAGPIPSGDPDLKEKRRKIREGLLNQEDAGTVDPAGKLSSFHWYDADPQLYRAELEAMLRFFPTFKLEKEIDGRLSWVGSVTPGLIGRRSRTYTLRAVYDHSHPSNSTYGGSVKVYSIEPDLEAIAQGERIPPTLRDGDGRLYLCTAGKEDWMAGRLAGSRVSTAAVAIAWAVKWLVAFELCLSGDMPEAEIARVFFKS